MAFISYLRLESGTSICIRHRDHLCWYGGTQLHAPRMMQRVEFAAICQIGDQWYEHEDGEVDWAFTHKDLDDLQDYDEGFNDDGHEELNLSAIESKLIFPRTSEHEPWLSPSELSELDRLADEFELARLGRSRYVAREFACFSPEKEGLYSPASSSVATKVLPAISHTCRLEMASGC